MGDLFVDKVKDRCICIVRVRVCCFDLDDNDYSQQTPIMETVPGPNYELVKERPTETL